MMPKTVTIMATPFVTIAPFVPVFADDTPQRDAGPYAGLRSDLALLNHATVFR